MNQKGKVLVVDDQPANRRLLEEYVTRLGHTAFLAENGLSALVQMAENPPDLVLLDVMMPELTGDVVLKRMRADPRFMDIPVIMISGNDEVESIACCVENGADDYLTKPFNTEILRARIKNCLERKMLRDAQVGAKRELEDYALRLEERVQEQVSKISAAHLMMIFALSKLAESRDKETGAHLERIQEFCKILAEGLGASPDSGVELVSEYIENLCAASPLHDIGKVGIPDHILLKPGKLTVEEFEIMKTHTTIGADTLRAVSGIYPDNRFVALGIEIAEAHHERWDGSGYPRGLRETDIPLSARILSVADVYDALRSKRVYKEPIPHEESCAIIEAGRGTMFDPKIVDVFMKHEAAFRITREKMADLDVQRKMADARAA